MNSYPSSGGSASGSFQVDTTALGSHAGDVDRIALDIEDAMALMQRKLEDLKGTWKGAAAGQYDELHGEWQRQQTSVKDALQDIARAAGAASSTYSRTEDDGRASFVTH